MSKNIKLKKGLDIKLKGEAEKVITPLSNVRDYALRPLDFIGVKPRLLVAEGDMVQAGTPIFLDKHNEQVLFTSPVSGIITEVKRGEKRVIEEIKIKADETIEYVDFGKQNTATISREGIVDTMLKSGVWTLLRQRPFSTIANPADMPKCIVISGFDSAPLAPDYDVIAHGKGHFFQLGLDILAKLTQGKVHLNLHPKQNLSGVFHNSKNVQINWFSGKHPAGNVGVQISHLDPINKGEVVWYMNPQDVIILGHLFGEGHYNAEKIIAVTGSEASSPRYYKIIAGTSVAPIIEEQVKTGNVRYISGNALTGKKIAKDGYLGAYHHQLTFLPEGNHYEFIGWAMPGLKKYSFSKTFLSGIISNLAPKKTYRLDTNLNGGHRALVITGEYEKVLPMDILPMNLIKACIIEDIDLMEQLGIYEVDEEDFALCEFIDTSKTDIQQIIRNGLDLVRKENS